MEEWQEKLRCRNSRKGAIGKQPETCQNKANGLSPPVTFTHDPLNNYNTAVLKRSARR
jgi:hypothetical protein